MHNHRCFYEEHGISGWVWSTEMARRPNAVRKRDSRRVVNPGSWRQFRRLSLTLSISGYQKSMTKSTRHCACKVSPYNARDIGNNAMGNHSAFFFKTSDSIFLEGGVMRRGGQGLRQTPRAPEAAAYFWIAFQSPIERQQHTRPLSIPRQRREHPTPYTGATKRTLSSLISRVCVD